MAAGRGNGEFKRENAERAGTMRDPHRLRVRSGRGGVLGGSFKAATSRMQTTCRSNSKKLGRISGCILLTTREPSEQLTAPDSPVRAPAGSPSRVPARLHAYSLLAFGAIFPTDEKFGRYSRSDRAGPWFSSDGCVQLRAQRSAAGAGPVLHGVRGAETARQRQAQVQALCPPRATAGCHLSHLLMAAPTRVSGAKATGTGMARPPVATGGTCGGGTRGGMCDDDPHGRGTMTMADGRD